MCSLIIIMELSAMKKYPVKCKVKFKEICLISFCLRYLLEKLCHYQAGFVQGQIFFLCDDLLVKACVSKSALKALEED